MQHEIMPDNFAPTLLSIQSQYHNRYPGEPADAEGWLYNNILSFMNDHVAANSGFTVNFLAFINRGENKRITNINAYLDKLDQMPCERAILQLWDKMTPKERDNFMLIHNR